MTTYQGYMVTADLENGVLTIKGSNKASRVALAGEDHATDVRLRREDIAGVGFKGASMLTNGTLTVWSVGGKAYKVHFRKKQADGMAQLRDALA